MATYIDIEGISTEIPRHVHHDGGVGQGGQSRIVETETELRAALADGWAIDPNAVPMTPPARETPPDDTVPMPPRRGRPPKVKA